MPEILSLLPVSAGRAGDQVNFSNPSVVVGPDVDLIKIPFIRVPQLVGALVCQGAWKDLVCLA